MADRVAPGPVCSSDSIKEAVCINTSKIFDSCRDKDCIEDLRVYPTVSSSAYIDTALSVRPQSAELLAAEVSVKEINFNRGYYTVDVSYFHRIKGETFAGGQPVEGLSVFDKRVMLFGSEARLKSFSSESTGEGTVSPLPRAVVNAVDPIALNLTVKTVDTPVTPTEAREIPDYISAMFSESLDMTDSARQLFVTLGQFSIIRLERDAQLLIPSYDYCMPEKECIGATEDDPCTMFSRIRFPVEEFFPPDNIECSDDYRNLI